MTNTNSAETNELPSAGADKVPPEFISSAGGKVEPKDSSPENTERMTGGTQGVPKDGPNAEMSVKDKGVSKQGKQGKTPGEMDVGEMEDIEFKVEPLKRSGEDANTMRARLLCMYTRDSLFRYYILKRKLTNIVHRPKQKARNPRIRPANVNIRRREPRKNVHCPNGTIRSLPRRK